MPVEKNLHSSVSKEHLRCYRTNKIVMYRFGLIYSLQDIVRLSSPRHSRLNLKYVGTGLGHKPVHTDQGKRREGGRAGGNT